jgi:endonuclease/exonuclease/phosphatase family metal-dependent hydrolase
MKFVTYNIQYGLGKDNRYDLARIAREVQYDSPSGRQLSVHRVRIERDVYRSLQRCRHPGGRHDDCSAHAHHLRS